MQVFKLRRKRNPTASVVELEATISAMKELRCFSADILRSLKCRINMVSDTRREIEDCARAAWKWVLEDEVKLSADKDVFEEISQNVHHDTRLVLHDPRGVHVSKHCVGLTRTCHSIGENGCIVAIYEVL